MLDDSAILMLFFHFSALCLGDRVSEEEGEHCVEECCFWGGSELVLEV